MASPSVRSAYQRRNVRLGCCLHHKHIPRHKPNDQGVHLEAAESFDTESVQVDSDAIVERHLKSVMTDTIFSLESLVKEWVAYDALPEHDWGRMRSLDFQELVLRRNQLAKQLDNSACTLCSDFEHHVRYHCAAIVTRVNAVMYSTQLYMANSFCEQTSLTSRWPSRTRI